jgi:hypothetical protein
MGMTVIARVVVGFELESQAVIGEKTKYNEDTGKPYAVQIETHRVGVCEGKIVTSTAGNPDALCEGEKIEGLTIYKAGHYGDIEHRRWLGEVVAQVKYEPGAVNFEYRVPESVNAFAAKHLIEPKQTLILYMG